MLVSVKIIKFFYQQFKMCVDCFNCLFGIMHCVSSPTNCGAQFA